MGDTPYFPPPPPPVVFSLAKKQQTLPNLAIYIPRPILLAPSEFTPPPPLHPYRDPAYPSPLPLPPPHLSTYLPLLVLRLQPLLVLSIYHVDGGEYTYTQGVAKKNEKRKTERDSRFSEGDKNISVAWRRCFAEWKLETQGGTMKRDSSAARKVSVSTAH